MHGQRGNEEDRTHFFNRHINNKEIKVKETVYNSQALRRRGVCLWWVLLVLCRGCKGGHSRHVYAVGADGASSARLLSPVPRKAVPSCW